MKHDEKFNKLQKETIKLNTIFDSMNYDPNNVVVSIGDSIVRDSFDKESKVDVNSDENGEEFGPAVNTIDSLLMYVDDFTEKQKQVLIDRNKEYSTPDKVIDGFKELGTIVGRNNIIEVFHYMIGLKMQRLNNGIKSNNIESKHFLDSILDLINYLQLLAYTIEIVMKLVNPKK